MSAPPLRRDLQPELSGTVLLPGEAEYEHELAGFNRIFEQRPSVVVAAANSADVLTAVRHAAERNLPVAVQSTGHGVAVPNDGGVLISTAAMKGVHIDPTGRTARVEAGVRWGELLRRTAPFGLTGLNGASPSVGTVGYVLGGGHGPLGRSYGYAADRVRGIELVTADGTWRRADPQRNPELFWGMRGGKGNFGVVTSMELELFEVSRVYGGGLFLPGESAEAALRTWRDWTRTVPDEMYSGIALVRFPRRTTVPEPVRGRFAVHLRIAYNGPAVEGERLVRPLRGIAPALLDTVTEMPYSRVGEIHMDPTEPGVYYERSARLAELDDAALSAVLDLVGPDGDCPLPAVELRHLGGALRRPPAHPNAVPYREAAYTVFSGVPVAPHQRAEVARHQQRLIEAVEPWRIGGPFLSFISARENDPDHVRSAYEPDTHERLTALKHAYDPDNLFRFNHNIPPSAERTV
ncbi:FAD-binding oxidoreductase [Actinopolyspora mortivallis]|uniref:FAD-dependent oxygenase n=1 Tax=Actinopolyspora mortivallis TaxID=33906 RepID=A0A2T0GVP0_ACTMO|nr:FAD-binding oxidoreductase [Actinopolyspora mortivallis]PRW63083.1 FAD-dependent oxygenase [Actinopolyspora mortivallis]